MYYPPGADIHAKQREGTLDIHRQQIICVKTDKPSMRQSLWTPTMNLAPYKHMLPAEYYTCLTLEDGI